MVHIEEIPRLSELTRDCRINGYGIGPAAYLTCDGSFAVYDACSDVYNECMALAVSVC